MFLKKIKKFLFLVACVFFGDIMLTVMGKVKHFLKGRKEMAESKQFQARQGDIFFQVVAQKGKGKELKPYSSKTLAYGEVTGHCHKIAESVDLSNVEMAVDADGDIFLRSAETVTIEHEEHGPITLPKNEWIMVSRQREFDPINEERERKVRD